MSILGQKRERHGPNNQPLVVSKKEEIWINLPHAMIHHAVPLSLELFHAHTSGFWHQNLIT